MDDGRNDNEKPVLKCELKEKDIKKDTYCEYSDSVKQATNYASYCYKAITYDLDKTTWKNYR